MAACSPDLTVLKLVMESNTHPGAENHTRGGGYTLMQVASFLHQDVSSFIVVSTCDEFTSCGFFVRLGKKI